MVICYLFRLGLGNSVSLRLGHVQNRVGLDTHESGSGPNPHTLFSIIIKSEMCIVVFESSPLRVSDLKNLVSSWARSATDSPNAALLDSGGFGPHLGPWPALSKNLD